MIQFTRGNFRQKPHEKGLRVATSPEFFELMDQLSRKAELAARLAAAKAEKEVLEIKRRWLDAANVVPHASLLTRLAELRETIPATEHELFGLNRLIRVLENVAKQDAGITAGIF